MFRVVPINPNTFGNIDLEHAKDTPDVLICCALWCLATSCRYLIPSRLEQDLVYVQSKQPAISNYLSCLLSELFILAKIDKTD